MIVMSEIGVWGQAGDKLCKENFTFTTRVLELIFALTKLGIIPSSHVLKLAFPRISKRSQYSGNTVLILREPCGR